MSQDTMKQSYDALIFRQRENAPLQVAFVASSADIDSWARVPTKQTGNVRNFQRAELGSHIQEVNKFFQNKDNASPTAVVVGFDPIRAGQRVRVYSDEGEKVDPGEIAPGMPRRGRIEIEWMPDDDPQGRTKLQAAIELRRAAVRDYVFQELKDITDMSYEQLGSLLEALVPLAQTDLVGTIGTNDSDGDRVDADDEFEGDLSSSDEDELGVPLPDDVEELLSGLSPSEKQVVIGRMQFLSRLTPDYLEGETEGSVQAVYREVNDELKPGILIDGQHRVMGTKKLGDIPFLVTALPHAVWPELAFQFIVTNRTAKRVAESLLISIVGNSLSKAQRAEIETRLREANIRVGLIEAVMRVHEDDASPFHGALAFGLKNEAGFLDAAAMRGKTIQLWYERKSPVKELFDHLCEGKRVSDRTEHWKSEEIWFEMFIEFWNAVRDRYEGSSVFSFELSDLRKKTPYSKLMTATVLKIFQETVLRNILDFVQAKETKEKIPVGTSIPNASAFSELVKNTLNRLTPEFFQGWQLSGFDGSKGARDDLAEAIQKVLDGDMSVSRLKDLKNPHRLFKE